MKTTDLKPAQILKGVKKANECKTLKEVQSNIKKVETIIEDLTKELGDCRLIPQSIINRQDSLDKKEAFLLDDGEAKADTPKADVIEFAPEVIETITGENEFKEVMHTAEVSGYRLVFNKDNAAVTAHEIRDKNGRKYVQLEAETGVSKAYYFDSATHPLKRYLSFQKK